MLELGKTVNGKALAKRARKSHGPRFKSGRPHFTFSFCKEKATKKKPEFSSRNPLPRRKLFLLEASKLEVRSLLKEDWKNYI